MTVENSTRNTIEKLAEVIVESPGEASSKSQGSFMLRQVPESGSMDDGDDPTWLYVHGEDVHRYFDALDALESDKVFEHLTRKELDTELAVLVHDLVGNQEQMKSSSVRRKRIKCFFSALARPLVPYEVVFNVERIKFSTECLTIDNVVFRDFSAELAKDWDCAKVEGLSRKMIQKSLDNLTGRAVGVVTVHAGSAEKAVERAQGYFDRALNILRVSIGSFRQYLIHDWEMLQRRSHIYVVRTLDPEPRPLQTGLVRRFRSADCDLDGALAQDTKCFIEQLAPLYDGTIQGRFRGALLRSLDRIGISITRENYDDKIVDLCIALETMITTKDDPRKGEAIALRSMLLSMALDDRFPHPSELRAMYRLRNKVVHGSALGEFGESDYRKLQWRTEKTVLNIIKLNSTQGPITSPNHLIKLLESLERLEKAICWLESWPDKETKALAEYARQRLKKQS